MIKGLDGLAGEWIEGVTPTDWECTHGVNVMTGTYLRDMGPTGEHPDCLAAMEQVMDADAAAYEAERWDEYQRTLSIYPA